MPCLLCFITQLHKHSYLVTKRYVKQFLRIIIHQSFQWPLLSIWRLSYLLQLLFNFRRPNNKRASYRILHSLYTRIHVFYCHKTFLCPLRTVTSNHIFTTRRHCSQKIWPASEVSAPVSRPPAAPRNIPRVDNMINNWCKQQRGGHNDNCPLLGIKYFTTASHSHSTLKFSALYIIFVYGILFLFVVQRLSMWKNKFPTFDIRYQYSIHWPSTTKTSNQSYIWYHYEQQAKRSKPHSFLEVKYHCSQRQPFSDRE